MLRDQGNSHDAGAMLLTMKRKAGFSGGVPWVVSRRVGCSGGRVEF
ncbi:MAG: hypothetical protein AAGE59_03960 [Cyanobacteria bacterium P01_F01_bin.86]